MKNFLLIIILTSAFMIIMNKSTENMASIGALADLAKTGKKFPPGLLKKISKLDQGADLMKNIKKFSSADISFLKKLDPSQLKKLDIDPAVFKKMDVSDILAGKNIKLKNSGLFKKFLKKGDVAKNTGDVAKKGRNLKLLGIAGGVGLGLYAGNEFMKNKNFEREVEKYEKELEEYFEKLDKLEDCAQNISEDKFNKCQEKKPSPPQKEKLLEKEDMDRYYKSLDIYLNCLELIINSKEDVSSDCKNALAFCKNKKPRPPTRPNPGILDNIPIIGQLSKLIKDIFGFGEDMIEYLKIFAQIIIVFIIVYIIYSIYSVLT